MRHDEVDAAEVDVSFERYRIEGSAFERYYDVFLQNMMRGRRFRITLVGGEQAVGVPTAGSIINPLDPNASFMFRSDSGQHFRIPFAALSDASPVDLVVGTIRTVDANTAAAGDIEVFLSPQEVELLWMAEGQVELNATLRGHRDFVDGAPGGTYKTLTVQGAAFRIDAIHRARGLLVAMTVTREDF